MLLLIFLYYYMLSIILSANPTISIYHADWLTFCKQIVSNIVSWRKSFPIIMDVFYYITNHDLKSPSDVTLKHIKIKVNDTKNLLISQLYTGLTNT